MLRWYVEEAVLRLDKRTSLSIDIVLISGLSEEVKDGVWADEMEFSVRLLLLAQRLRARSNKWQSVVGERGTLLSSQCTMWVKLDGCGLLVCLKS